MPFDTLVESRFASKAPMPWFGGKSNAAPLVWQLLGDVDHYCEPFAGSLAVLLNRPHPCNRAYYSETVNDVDGLLVNAWRSIQSSPDATADAASWPVMEADKSRGVGRTGVGRVIETLESRLVRLNALRSFLHGASHADLDLVIQMTQEAIRRPSLTATAKAGVAAILDMILSVDPRFAAEILATAARATEQALAIVRGRAS